MVIPFGVFFEARVWVADTKGTAVMAVYTYRVDRVKGQAGGDRACVF